jgi:hypothetical protein
MIKMNELKDEINETKVQLTNFIIGTSMESALQKEFYLDTQDYQWQQLFPKHITDFIKYYKNFDNDINVNIIIISPEDIFMDDYYQEPLFTTKCKDFKFDKIKNREYICIYQQITIKINIFTCPFPQLETRTDIIDKYNFFIKTHKIYGIEDLTPSISDVNFINNFYSQIKLLFAEKKFNVIVNSYATFRNIRLYDNFGLFSTLLKLAIEYKIIATEWIFNEYNFKYRMLSCGSCKVNFINFGVSYIDPLYTPHLFLKYTKITKEEVKKIKNELNDKILDRICILLKFPYGKTIYTLMTN